MDLTLATQAYERGAEGSAESICKNLYPARKEATDGRAVELRTTPGLEPFVTLSGNVRGYIATDGLFDGDIFAVAGAKFVRITSAGVVTELGAVPLTGNVTMAASRIEIAVCVAPKMYIYDGSTFAEVTDEDLPNVTSVDYINQRFIVSDDADRPYWTDLLDGSAVDGLNFLTAEAHPDKLVRVLSDGESFYAMGTRTIERIGAVSNPSSASAAFARIGSGVIKVGLAGIHAATVDVSTKIVGFVGSDRVIYITQGYDPQPISSTFINDELAKATDEELSAARCFAYSEGGDTHFVTSVPNVGTFVFLKSLGQWHTRSTGVASTWRADMHQNAWGQNYVASSSGAIIYRLSRDVLTDAGEVITREFTASSPVRSINEIRDVTVDAYADRDAKISMRKRKRGSKRQWGPWIDRSLQSPDNLCAALFRRLGKTFPPEEVFHFRVTDECGLVVTGVRANDGVAK